MIDNKKYEELVEFIDSNVKVKNFKAKGVLKALFNITGGVENEVPPKELWGRVLQLIIVAQYIRSYIGVPVYVNSSYRGKKYNDAVGSNDSSMHRFFGALDLRSEAPIEKMAEAAYGARNMGLFIGGIGIYNNFIHIDNKGERNRDWDNR